MYRYKFIYSDGSEFIKEFSSRQAANWYALMEGDHLFDYYEITASGSGTS